MNKGSDWTVAIKSLGLFGVASRESHLWDFLPLEGAVFRVKSRHVGTLPTRTVLHVLHVPEYAEVTGATVGSAQSPQVGVWRDRELYCHRPDHRVAGRAGQSKAEQSVNKDLTQVMVEIFCQSRDASRVTRISKYSVYFSPQLKHLSDSYENDLWPTQ